MTDIRELAHRAHLRLLAARRHRPDAKIPISTAFSLLLEHDPEYEPYRPRRTGRRRGPTKNPGIFTVQAIARTLGTTVGDLLGEPNASTRDLFTVAQRRTLRDAWRILRDALDLDDPSL